MAGSGRVLEMRKFVCPEFVFGLGARLLAGRSARNVGGRKVLLVSDPGVARAGWTGEVRASLVDEGLTVIDFDRVSPNPRGHEVTAGSECFLAQGCDAIVAVGGGSVIDCAKGIGIASANRCDVLEFEGVDRVPVPGPPLVCIPTTGGTSADVSQFAIIRDSRGLVKIAIVSKLVVPDVALIDPVTLCSMDAALTAATGMDAIVHAVEAYLSNAHSPLTDLHALEALRLLCGNLVASMERRDDLELRGAVMLGSLEAGLAFSNASLGCVHAMAHSLGGLLDLPHGECNAMLLPHVLRFNLEAVPEPRLRELAGAFGLELSGRGREEVARGLLGEIERLRQATGTAHGLRVRGVSSSDVPELARKAIQDPCVVTNPRRPVPRDLEVLFEEAL